MSSKFLRHSKMSTNFRILWFVRVWVKYPLHPQLDKTVSSMCRKTLRISCPLMLVLLKKWIKRLYNLLFLNWKGDYINVWLIFSYHNTIYLDTAIQINQIVHFQWWVLFKTEKCSIKATWLFLLVLCSPGYAVSFGDRGPWMPTIERRIPTVIRWPVR